MQYLVKCPSVQEATITLPASKSLSNRQLLINVLAGNTSPIANLSASDDTKVMLTALNNTNLDKHIDVGAAGTSMRFLTAYLALIPGNHTITGSERMKKRPIGILVDALRKLGAEITYMENEGFPPLAITGGKLHGGEVTIPGNISSQYLSAIMMIAPMIKGGLKIHLEGKIVSMPYINMTIGTMSKNRVAATWEGNTITIPEQQYRAFQGTMESDWSAASYWYEISALSHKSFNLLGLAWQSLQGDSKGADIAYSLGVDTAYRDYGVEVGPVADGEVDTSSVFEFDFVNQPDLAQTYVVLCCLINRKFKFTGLESLKIKEADRIAALVSECKKIGFVLKTNGVDTIEWSGETCAPSDEPILTYKDHRMAMAFAPAAIVRGSVIIDDPAVVSKSYPNYWADLKSAGFTIE